MKYYQTGVLFQEKGACAGGYTLLAPFRHHTVYLVDLAGETVHLWELPGPLGSKGYLLPGGHLLCAIKTEEGPELKNAIGGRMVEMDWDGNIVWEHIDHGQHHDVRRFPNGNTAYVAWELLSNAEAARVSGGVPGTERNGKIYGDVFREVNPAGDIVWEWAFKDVDMEKYPLAIDCQREEWAHANSCAPTPDGDYLINFRHLDTMMIVDRATKEIKWEMRDPDWGHQHNPEFTAGGTITFFANGMNNLNQPLHSSAMELDPATGKIVWSYTAPQRWTFFSPVMGGVQRLDNGNTLICEAIHGRVFEVTRDGHMVWDFINPHFEETDRPFDGPSNALFRAYRYAADSEELQGRV